MRGSDMRGSTVPQLKKGVAGQYLCTTKNAVGKKIHPVSVELQSPTDLESEFSRWNIVTEF